MPKFSFIPKINLRKVLCFFFFGGGGSIKYWKILIYVYYNKLLLLMSMIDQSRNFIFFTFNLHNNPMRYILLPSSFRWRNRYKRLGNSLKVTLLISRKVVFKPSLSHSREYDPSPTWTSQWSVQIGNMLIPLCWMFHSKLKLENILRLIANVSRLRLYLKYKT